MGKLTNTPSWVKTKLRREALARMLGFASSVLFVVTLLWLLADPSITETAEKQHDPLYLLLISLTLLSLRNSIIGRIRDDE